MTEILLTDTDPSLLAPNPTSPELQEKVQNVLEFFRQEFSLEINDQGELTVDPSEGQLTAMHEWHLATKVDGHDMPDFDSFTAKMILARALMPQQNERGEIQYLFGKGAGAELALQGQIVGRTKRLMGIPYRTHDDFEIYAANITSYDSPDSMPFAKRFKAVFGGQEIYPEEYTKGLHDLPLGYLQETAEQVDFGGFIFLVPSLELQFVDKFEKGNNPVERGLREKTDAEWLAGTYELDKDLVNAAIDDFVIKPEMARLSSPEEFTTQHTKILKKKIEHAKENLIELAREQGSELSSTKLNSKVPSEVQLRAYCQKYGIAIDEILDTNTGELKANADEFLAAGERARQVQLLKRLQNKHIEVDEILAKAA